MKLVLVESPTKARTLSRFFDSNYTVAASMGHLRDLPKSELGVDIETDFKPTYVIPEGKKKIVTDLKKLAGKAKEVILATDLDREGEAIAYHLQYLLKDKTITFSRITFHEITRSAVEEALRHPGKVNLQLVFSQQARRVLDRLVGYKLSPLLWRKVRRGLSAGRVQTPAVRLIVEREREIKAFKAEEYWLIWVELETDKKEKFRALLNKIDDKKAEINKNEQAKKLSEILKKCSYRVQKVEKREVKNSPPPPFITSTLQRSGSSLFGWSGKKTMKVAQTLYEKGLITYHRTDSFSLASQALTMCRHYIEKTYGQQYLPPQPRFYKTKSKLAQEAHEAIRPTRLERKLKILNQELKLYKLVLKRFVSSQMNDQIIDRTIVDIEAVKEQKKYLFRAQGEKEQFDGWKKLYQKLKIKNEKLNEKLKVNNNNNAFLELPPLAEGEILELIKVISEQKFTQPPLRYTEASLIKALEEREIGRPSTYAPIISTIQQRQYVEKIEAKFQPTTVGETVNDFLVKHFNDIVDYDFTAKCEDDFDKIAQGKEKWLGMIKRFYKPFEKKLKQVQKNAKREKIEAETTGRKCPKCQKGEQVIRLGRFGKFLSCSRFPDCDWKTAYVEKLKGIKCPKCGADVVFRRTKKGRHFYGCASYPKCDWASWQKPK